ncbi:molybdopterin-dependent oxidoreductase [Pendulispora brunnea]|uniref:Molybdopterin-dependent oxidoreductase n=1 Tax=Pendulispora brunnea TaxID=2905690 RepID=A0ABZ2K5Q4_9BACT
MEKPSRLIAPSMLDRRTFLRAVAAGTGICALGGATYVLADDDATRRAAALKRPDGRPRLPPSQFLLQRLRPMGGSEGDPSAKNFKLRVYGEVEAPFEIDFAELLKMPQVEQTCDVHCVTKWTVLDSHWTGVRVADLAERAKVKKGARHVIFEAVHGYTSNVLLREALAPNVLVAHRYEGAPLARPHGAPVRALVPDLYFWKSAKWLTGIRFSAVDQPGYWEVRGYNNHADPWREERYG